MAPGPSVLGCDWRAILSRGRTSSAERSWETEEIGKPGCEVEVALENDWQKRRGEGGAPGAGGGVRRVGGGEGRRGEQRRGPYTEVSVSAAGKEGEPADLLFTSYVT